MSAQHLQGHPLALFRQSYTAIFSVIDRALFHHSLRHIRHGRRTHVQGLGQGIRRYAIMLALQGIYSFQEVLYRLRRSDESLRLFISVPDDFPADAFAPIIS